MRNRSLTLKRETLTALTTDDLTAVVGGSHLCLVTDNCTHVSVDATCPSVPVTNCLDTIRTR
ncbi:MAG TPA: hypothetical protein VF519_08430 [Mycobacteriales bacterium]|jgi:hypothetical protein